MCPHRIFVASISHETNSFSPLPTTLRSFEAGLHHRQGDPRTIESAREVIGYGDALRIAQEQGDDAIAGMCTYAEPAGPLSRAGYETLRDELLRGLAQTMAGGALDAVFLVLHGAMMADGTPDCEGDLLMAVRQLVGPDMPVGALLDLHGNVSSAMIDSGAFLVACKEYPHTDYADRATELYAMLTSVAARSGPQPRTSMHRVPMVGIFGTTEEPMSGFVRRLKACEERPGILSVSAMHGFPCSDSADTGAAILIVSEGPRQATDALLAELAAEFFTLRLQVPSRRLTLDEALDKAVELMATADGPVVLADGADNPGGGAACDSTFVLQALIERGVEGVALGMLWDPQAAMIAADVGVGAHLALRVGGKVGPMSGAPVDLMVEVMAVRRDARQRGLDGKPGEQLGLAVAVRASGIDIVINSLRQQVYSTDCFTELGIDPRAKRLIVVKSTQHFRAAFDPFAAANVYCDAPGTLNGDLARLPYQALRRPMWPLDEFASLSDVSPVSTTSTTKP